MADDTNKPGKPGKPATRQTRQSPQNRETAQIQNEEQREIQAENENQAALLSKNPDPIRRRTHPAEARELNLDPETLFERLVLAASHTKSSRTLKNLTGRRKKIEAILAFERGDKDLEIHLLLCFAEVLRTTPFYFYQGLSAEHLAPMKPDPSSLHEGARKSLKKTAGEDAREKMKPIPEIIRGLSRGPNPGLVQNADDEPDNMPGGMPGETQNLTKKHCPFCKLPVEALPPCRLEEIPPLVQHYNRIQDARIRKEIRQLCQVLRT